MRKFLFASMLIFLLTTPAYAEGRFVQSVVDGQTLKLLNGEYVHLLGIDIDADQFDKAAAYVRSLVSGSVVALEYDVEKADQEGNILAYVWFRYEPRIIGEQVLFPQELDVHYVVDSEGEGDFFVLLNTTVVKAGFAQPSEGTTNTKYSSLINKLYAERPIETVKAELEITSVSVTE